MEEDFRVVYKNENGVAIVTPTNSEDAEGVIANSVPAGSEYKVVSVSQIPKDRDFREAWEYISGVDINLEKAKEVQRNRWRKTRALLLKELDVKFLIASEQENVEQINIVKEKKQILRDVTLTDLSAVNSLEELKEIWPECLLGSE